MADNAERIRAGREAAAIASEVCRSVQRDLDAIRTVTKDDRSPVTVADYAAQAVVCHVLRDRLGPFEMIGEEDADELRRMVDSGESAIPDAVLSAIRGVLPGMSMAEALDAIDMGNGEASADGFWTLDPIDGTKGFLRGQQYAVSLGWIERGTVMVGVLACPNLSRDFDRGFESADPTGSMYTAIRGGGVMAGPCTPDGAAGAVLLEPEPLGSELRVCASVEKAHSSVSDTDRLLTHASVSLGVPVAEPARLDSQAKYAVVARGQAGAYLRLPAKKGYVEKIWDHAAGSLVAEESGAVVTDVRGEPLDFSKGSRLSSNTGVICAAAPYHAVLVDGVLELGLGSGDNGEV